MDQAIKQLGNYKCDVCDSDDAEEIKCLSEYTRGEPIHVCRKCGFVYIKQRRSFQEIADSWSNEIYSINEGEGTNAIYTAVRPAIKARLFYILETIDAELGLESKQICDIGAGEGVFLNYLYQLKYKVKGFGVEPSAKNCQLINRMDIPNYQGTIEDYMASVGVRRNSFDIVTILWTLENCQNCRAMLEAACKLLKPEGHLVIGTGSRILVPFKKPLHYYVGPGNQDTHCFRFSTNSLSNLIALAGFELVYVNCNIDHDVLLMMAQKRKEWKSAELKRDDYQDIIDFFERWHKETENYYSAA